MMDPDEYKFLRDLQRRLGETAVRINSGPWVTDLVEMAGDIAQHIHDKTKGEALRDEVRRMGT